MQFFNRLILMILMVSFYIFFVWILATCSFAWNHVLEAQRMHIGRPNCQGREHWLDGPVHRSITGLGRQELFASFRPFQQQAPRWQYIQQFIQHGGKTFSILFEVCTPLRFVLTLLKRKFARYSSASPRYSPMGQNELRTIFLKTAAWLSCLSWLLLGGFCLWSSGQCYGWEIFSRAFQGNLS